MPLFGDYETVGEPLAVSEQGSYVSTVWKVRRMGASGGEFCAIKCFARLGSGGADQQQDTLGADAGLEFLETVKQLKKAHSDAKKARSPASRCLAPIHEFGTSPEGVWYRTDLYQRTTNSLKAWMAVRGLVDSAALRHVVYSIVSGCLALQRSCGRSHGNLKPSNVFLAGKPRQALRKTPLQLVDPLPASLFRAPDLDADDRQTVLQLIREISEAQDLQAIGLVILQLVEGREIHRSEYNYPIDRSSSWDKLGKEGEQWRGLCNRLLDPHLSLIDVNLESLTKEFRPSQWTGLPLKIATTVGESVSSALGNVAGVKWLAKAAAAAGAVCLISFIGYYGISKIRQWAKDPERIRRSEQSVALKKFKESMNVGMNLLQNREFNNADFKAAEEQFAAAKAIAKSLNDGEREKEAEDGRLCAVALSRAKTAGEQQEVVDRLAEASGYKAGSQVGALASWRQSAEAKLAEQKKADLRNSEWQQVVGSTGFQKAIASWTAYGLESNVIQRIVRNDFDALENVTNNLGNSKYEPPLILGKVSTDDLANELRAVRRIVDGGAYALWRGECNSKYGPNAINSLVPGWSTSVIELDQRLQAIKLDLSGLAAEASNDLKKQVASFGEDLKTIRTHGAEIEKSGTLGGRKASELKQEAEGILRERAALEMKIAKASATLASVQQNAKDKERTKDLEQARNHQNNGRYSEARRIYQKWGLSNELAMVDSDEGTFMRLTNNWANADYEHIPPLEELPTNHVIRTVWANFNEEKQIFEVATNKFNQGDYSFTNSLAGFAYKARVQSLIRYANNEEGLLAKARELRRKAQESEKVEDAQIVKTFVSEKQIRKKPFNQILEWVEPWLSSLIRKEYDTAASLYTNGEYEVASDITKKYPCADSFRSLVSLVTNEWNILNATRADFEKGEYSFIRRLKEQSCSTKRPFQNLITLAEKESETLTNLTTILNETNGWTRVLGYLDQSPSLSKKPPFAALRSRASTLRDQFAQLQQKRREALDMQLRNLMIEFSVKPIGPTIRAEGGTVKPLRRIPQERAMLDQKTNHVASLRGNYAQEGLASDSERRGDLKRVEDAIREAYFW